MNRRFLVVLVVCLALIGLMMSCKNDIEIREEFGQELVSVTFAESSGTSRGLSASLEDFNKNIENYYWGYAAKKSAKDTSQMKRGETPNYATSVVWLKTSGSDPLPGLPTNPIPGFSQGYWDFRLCAYKKVNIGTLAEPEYHYVLVYQGETKEFLLKSSSTNETGNNLVTVTVNPVSISGQNGTLIIKTTDTDAIKLNKVDEASTYGANYFPRIISVESMTTFPVEYVDTVAEKTKASCSADGVFSLPAGSYKITFAFADSETAPTVNYARGTIVATVYSNLDTTIKGDLSEMTTSVTIQPELNPELVTYTAVSGDITIEDDTTTSITFSSTGVARKVEAKTTAVVTNKIINDMASTSGTTTGYNQNLKLNLNVETVEATETTATYEIGMTATLTSTSTSDPEEKKTSTSDVSSVAKYVTVTLGIQEGLTSVSAYHNGIAMNNLNGFELGDGWTVSPSVVDDVVVVKKVKSGESDVDITSILDDVLKPLDTQNKGFFFYDSTGVVVFITKSFSPYSLSFVKPLPAAFVAEVGGFKYTKLETAIKKAASKETITLLKNVALSGNTNLNKSEVVLDLANFSIDTGAYKFQVTGANASVKNGTIKTIEVKASDVKLDNLTVTAGVEVSASGVEINGCSITGTSTAAVSVTDGDVTIDGGTYTAGEGTILSGKILVVDGNFKGTTLAPSQDSVSLTGGVYEYNVSDFVAKGYECAKVSESVYKVRKIYEARNVGKGIDYYFLQDAIDASSAGDVIEILININAEKTITVPAEKGLTIRLGETTELQTFVPHTITTNAKLGLVNNGSLTIEGPGSLSNNYQVDPSSYDDKTNYPLAIKNNGTLVLDKSCIIECVHGRVVDNYDSLTINVAELKAKNLADVLEGSNSYGDYLIHSVKGTIYVDGLVINNTTTAKGVFQITDGSTLTVENATIDIVCSCYLVDLRNGSNGKSTATINAGSFKTTKKYYNDGNLTDCYQQMFTFKDKVSTIDGSVLTINGGTFVFDCSASLPNYDYCPEYVKFENISSTSNLSTLVVNGGTFKSIGVKDSKTILPTHLYYTPGSINVILSVGTFDVSSDTYDGGNYPAYVLDPGSKKVFEDNLLVVSKIPESEGVVSVERVNADPVYFLNFEDAVDYVESGDTINILKDCTASYHGDNKYDFSGKDITIHVNEGKTLSCGDVTNGKFVIGWNNAKGTLTLEGPGKITFTSNGTWGLITDNGVGNDIKAVVKNITIEASSANGYIMTGGHLTVESGYYKNIAFDYTGKAISGGYYTTDVSKYVISGKRCMENTAYPSTSDYQYYITDSDPIKNFLKIHDGHLSYYENLVNASDGYYYEGDVLRFIGSNPVFTQTTADDRLWDQAGVTYDLNGHTITMDPYYGYTLFTTGGMTVMDGIIDVPAEKFCDISIEKINAINVYFADRLFAKVMEKVNGYYVKDDKAGFFSIQESIPAEEDVKAKILRGDKHLYYTNAVSDITKVENGDTIYVNLTDTSAIFTLKAEGDIITIVRADENIDFPIVLSATGSVEEKTTSLDGNVKEYKATPDYVWQIGDKKYTYDKQSEAFSDMSGGGTIKLLRDLDLGENGNVIIDSWTANATYTVDFNGHVITASCDSWYMPYMFRINNPNDGIYVFKDGTGNDIGGIKVQDFYCSNGLISFGSSNKSYSATVQIESGMYYNKYVHASYGLQDGSIIHKYVKTLTTEVSGGSFSKRPIDKSMSGFVNNDVAYLDGTWTTVPNADGYYVKQ